MKIQCKILYQIEKFKFGITVFYIKKKEINYLFIKKKKKEQY